MIRIAVLGAGHWGPNLIRNLNDGIRSEVRWVVDPRPDRLKEVKARFPSVKLSERPEDALDDPEVDAMVIATPTVTHYGLVKAALERDKHVMVEKPLTNDSTQARELVELASRRDRTLMVGHIFIYNQAVQWVKRILDEGELGRVYYLSSQRTNLGPIRMDVNAAWDLGSQDLAVFNYWLDATPISASAVGGTWINPGIEDAVFATLRYPNDVLVHFHVSWLNPVKGRLMTVVADRRMLTFDDLNSDEPLRLYDKQVTDQRTAGFDDSFAKFRAHVRNGDISIPRVDMGEPLRNECQHFLDCMSDGRPPLTGGPEALAVVESLEAIERSMRNNGVEERL